MAAQRILQSLRLPNWETRLYETVETRREQPFSPGLNDCCVFAADSVEAVIGIDVLSDMRGLWDSIRSMRICLMAVGSLDRAVTLLLGSPMLNPLFIQRGDIAIINRSDPQLAVCIGLDLVAPSRHGLISHPLTSARLAWRVGHG